MNTLIDNNIITEITCGNNFSYVLSNNDYYLMTEYKVLQSQGNDIFIKCMKTLYNEKINLFYLSDGYKSFQSIADKIDPQNFMKVIANTFSNIIEVKNNGFLLCQNLNISFDKIFVDISTLRIMFVYLPINKKLYDSYSSFENELRTSLIKLIDSKANLRSEKTQQFAIDLSDGALSIEDLLNKLKGIRTPLKRKNPIENRTTQNSNIKTAKSHPRIVAMNSAPHFEMIVNKDNYIIGRNSSSADGVITYNKAVGRSHCKITEMNGKYYIIDLNSTNGTFLNEQKLLPNEPCAINDKDVLRLADSSFQICID